MSETVKTLTQRIEEKRKALYAVMASHELISLVVIKMSQELDELIVENMRRGGIKGGTSSGI